MQMNRCRHLVPLYPYHATNYNYHNLITFNCVLLRRLRFSSDADIVRLTNARIIIIIIICLRFQLSLQSNQT